MSGFFLHDLMMPSPSITLSPQEIHRVRWYIRKCLSLYMTREETFKCLEIQCNIDPAVTQAVGEKLEDDNREFFRQYCGILQLMNLFGNNMHRHLPIPMYPYDRTVFVPDEGIVLDDTSHQQPPLNESRDHLLCRCQAFKEHIVSSPELAQLNESGHRLNNWLWFFHDHHGCQAFKEYVESGRRFY